MLLVRSPGDFLYGALSDDAMNSLMQLHAYVLRRVVRRVLYYLFQLFHSLVNHIVVA